MHPSPQETPGAASPNGPFGARTGLVLLGLVVAFGFVACLLTATRGHFVPPVVDLYLVCRYAQAFAEGHPFQYNVGELPSTGATSLLHTLLLAAAHALGARGEGLVAFAMVFGAVAFLGAIVLAQRIGSRLADERAGLLAGALVALCGPVAWGFLYGSDIALFMLLVLWFFDRLLVEYPEGRMAGTATAGVLLSLARPEGLVVAAVLAAGAALDGRRFRMATRVAASAPLMVALALAVFYRLLTGSWGGSSVADKSLLANYGLMDSLALTADYLTDLVRGLLLGFYPSQTPVGFSRGFAPYFFPPLALGFVLVGLCKTPTRLVRPVLLCVLAASLGILAVTPNTFMGVHFNRYVMWVFPGILVLTAAGISAVSRFVAREDASTERRAFVAMASLCVGLGVLSVVRFGAIYGDMGGEVFRRDVSAAQWISRNLPKGVHIANIATGIEYLTGHRNLNLHGVTSPQFFGNLTAEREAGTLESLARLPVDERPEYLLTSTAVQEGSALMRELVTGSPLFESSSLGDELLLLRMRWDLVGRQSRPASPEALAATAGLSEVDRLNVCDRHDEQAHHYSYDSRLGGLVLRGAVVLDTYKDKSLLVADGGRAILGAERMRIATPLDGHDLVVVLRATAAPNVAVLRASGSGIVSLDLSEQTVQVDGISVRGGRSTVRLRPGWNEIVLRVPAAQIEAPWTELTISGRYAAYHYWFYQ